ncbi:hypothetical protein NCCP1664_01700 [Zafaria cholistanensis]|uniref:TM2 domain-containing protein n=1 Tax=Zafaria cholistanensis TaxID=1682741 RepID=A0A5A7NL44_9MICC|nr:NINE protein [Zafaria cholistanensis]GER21673.1 hypothetical protein NCCP1664_01700 [Zafaria cholistanensis]
MSQENGDYPSQPSLPHQDPQVPYQQARYQQAPYQQAPYQQAGPGPYVQPYPGYPMPVEPKSRLVAGLLGIFLGGLGIHRFYLGHTKIGLLQLLLSVVLGFFTFGLSSLLVSLWGFIEGIMILAGAQMFRADAKGVPLRG